MTTQRCGYIACLGAPNAGKSTLVNAIMGQKVTIVSPKAQTTRARILGILTEGDTQAVFMDTPGLFKPTRPLERAMVAAAWGARDEADMIAVVIDVAKANCVQGAERLLKGVRDEVSRKPVVLVMNKVDLQKRDTLLPIAQALNDQCAFAATFMVSAKTGSGVDDFKAWCVARLPEGPFLYDADIASDHPDRLLAADITREKLFMRLHQELPYGLTVRTDTFETQADGSLRIAQTILVETERHKPMVIGHQGQVLKRIGQMAREEMNDIFGATTHLFLNVVVKPNWQESREILEEIGLDPAHAR